jgi:hypothetical protein
MLVALSEVGILLEYFFYEVLKNEVTAEGKLPSGFMTVMNEFDGASNVNLV